MRAARDRRMLAAKRPRTGDEHERVVARSQVVARRFRTIFCRSHSNTRCVTHFTKQYQVGVGARVVHTLSTFCTAARGTRRPRGRRTPARPASTFNRGVVGAVRRPSRDKLQVQRLKRWSRASKHEGRRTANAHRPRTEPPAHRPRTALPAERVFDHRRRYRGTTSRRRGSQRFPRVALARPRTAPPAGSTGRRARAHRGVGLKLRHFFAL